MAFRGEMDFINASAKISSPTRVFISRALTFAAFKDYLLVIKMIVCRHARATPIDRETHTHTRARTHTHTHTQVDQDVRILLIL